VFSHTNTLTHLFRVTFETITTSENRLLTGQDDYFAGRPDTLVGRPGMFAGRHGLDSTVSLLLQSFTFLCNNPQ